QLDELHSVPGAGSPRSGQRKRVAPLARVRGDDHLREAAALFREQMGGAPEVGLVEGGEDVIQYDDRSLSPVAARELLRDGEEEAEAERIQVRVAEVRLREDAVRASKLRGLQQRGPLVRVHRNADGADRLVRMDLRVEPAALAGRGI